MVNVVCEICGKEERVYKSRSLTYKTCSVECRGKRSSVEKKQRHVKQCPTCLNDFELKKSHIDRRKYCSKTCQAVAYTTRYLGKNNPNCRHRHEDLSGYKISHEGKTVAVHRMVAMEVLKIDTLPSGYQVHHRDCDVKNNDPENLALLSNSDHRWLHKQYGSATLWAFMRGLVDKATLVSWSNDFSRASQILDLNLTNQSVVFKSDELLETPEKDNQQPSPRKP